LSFSELSPSSSHYSVHAFLLCSVGGFLILLLLVGRFLFSRLDPRTTSKSSFISLGWFLGFRSCLETRRTALGPFLVFDRVFPSRSGLLSGCRATELLFLTSAAYGQSGSFLAKCLPFGPLLSAVLPASDPFVLDSPDHAFICLEYSG